jgi:serine O-acetyltransferase
MRKVFEAIYGTLVRLTTSRAAAEPSLLVYIREDKYINGALRPGFHALLMYRIGRWASQRPSRRKPFLWLASAMAFFIRNFYGIELYWTADIGRRLYIAHQGGILLHPHCKIGDNCVVRQGSTIGASEEMDATAEAPVLGDNVQVGAGAMVLGKIRIGNNVRIGPNAVVMTDVPDNSTVMAPPSRIITWGESEVRTDQWSG